MTSSNHGDHEDRRQIGQDLRRISARLGLDSERKIADAITEDRGMVGRVLDGDETVSLRKWQAVESKIRALDESMGSEREDSAPVAPHRVVVRASGNFGVTFMVEGDVADLGELEDAIIRLVKRMESAQD